MCPRWSGFSAPSRVESRGFISTLFRVGHCARFGVTSSKGGRVARIRMAMAIKRVNFNAAFSHRASTATQLYSPRRECEGQTNLLFVALLTYCYSLNSLRLHHDRNTVSWDYVKVFLSVGRFHNFLLHCCPILSRIVYFVSVIVYFISCTLYLRFNDNLCNYTYIVSRLREFGSEHAITIYHYIVNTITM